MAKVRCLPAGPAGAGDHGAVTPLKATAVADQISATLSVAVALVVVVVSATKSPDSTQFEKEKHCSVPVPDISRLVKAEFSEGKFSFLKLLPLVNQAKTRSFALRVVGSACQRRAVFLGGVGGGVHGGGDPAVFMDREHIDVLAAACGYGDGVGYPRS